MTDKSPYGLHRVIEPVGTLPQSAKILNNSPEICENEILIDVDILNITSASFARLKSEIGLNEEDLGREIMRIIKTQGKYQDPILGSGGMLVGRIEKIGDSIKNKNCLKVGDSIATMVSLTATPLKIDKVLSVNTATDQVRVKGKAVLFERSLYTILPDNLPYEISLAIMDVAGAPAMVAKTVKAGDYVLVLGGGKAGLLCLHEAKKRVGVTGKTIVVEYSKDRCQVIQKLGLADDVVNFDATKPVEIMNIIDELTDGHFADFTINVVNIEDSEMACVLSTNDNGTIFFYNTSTSFTKAALGAESVGKPVKMLMGNGYVPGHDKITFQIMEENQKLRAFFEEYYIKKQ